MNRLPEYFKRAWTGDRAMARTILRLQESKGHSQHKIPIAYAQLPLWILYSTEYPFSHYRIKISGSRFNYNDNLPYI